MPSARAAAPHQLGAAMIRDAAALLAELRHVHRAIRDAVVAACEAQTTDDLSAVVAEAGGDTIFALDRISEAALVAEFAAIGARWSCVLIAEGLGMTEQIVLPAGTRAADAELRIIVDPIDGTRGLMYQKRPAWILTGVAPNRGPATTLADIELALQTEISLVKQHLSDSFWTMQGNGVGGERWDRLRGQGQPLAPRPSRATTLAQGFGGIARFFPGARGELATIDDLVAERLLGPVEAGRAQCFEDQYICTGGQLAELIQGHDRWQADLRPLTEALLERRGQRLGICCHPYDLCTELIAREAGVIVTGLDGQPLAAPLDTTTDVGWLGFANAALAAQVGPVLRAVLAERGLLASDPEASESAP